MSETPLISLIIPAYNVAPYLPQCLDSAIGQTYPNLEIIVVNDGSTDQTPEIAHAYAGRDPRIRVVDKPNGGLVMARKSGLDASRGKYIMHLDGDDYLATDAVESLYDCIERTQADVACADLYRVSDAYRLHIRETWDGVIDSDTLLRMLLLHRTEGPLWNRLYRAELFQNLDHPAFVSHGEDYVINLQIYQLPLRIAHINKPLYYYVKRSDAITQHRLSFDYTVRFLDYAEGLLKRNNEIYSRYQAHITVMKVYYYYLYINRTSNPDVTDSEFVRRLYREMKSPEVKRLLKENLTGTQRAVIRLHKRPATAWIGKVLTTASRIRQSIAKRTTQKKQD